VFHIINRNSPAHFGAVLGLVMGAQGENPPLIASQNKLDDLPVEKWAHNFGVLHFPGPTGAQDKAVAVGAAIGGPVQAARIAMVDEVRTRSMAQIADFAALMRDFHPEAEGRWGCYIANGPRIAYSGFAPAIEGLLEANAHIAVEMYPRYTDYCRAGSTTEKRDAWLARFFMGGPPFPKDRFGWIMRRRAELGSRSHVTVLFGVTDKGKTPGKLDYLAGPRPAVFLDRIFFVWVNRTGHAPILHAENGGAGSYKWDKEAVSNATRGKAFVESWNHYCRDKETASRLGPVRCG
jgi:hypothetical protein